MVYTVAGINPGNHAAQDPQMSKTGKTNDPATVPFPSGYPVGQQPVLVPSSNSDFARPLPKGPERIFPASPGPAAPMTVEPPLAPNVPPFIPPPANPAPPQTYRTPAPILVPLEGPILNPPR
jgi:hypothetical protein